MRWKDKIKDPEYLMNMRRPTFIAARSVSLFSARLKLASVSWMYREILQDALSLIRARPQIPTISLPNITDSHNVGNIVSKSPVVRATRPVAKQFSSGYKKAMKQARKWGLI